MDYKKIMKNGTLLSSAILTISFGILMFALFVLDYIPLRYRIVVFLLSVSFTMAVLLVSKKALWRFTLAITIAFVSIGMYASKELIYKLGEVSSVEYVEYHYIEAKEHINYVSTDIVAYYGVNWTQAKTQLFEQNPDLANKTIKFYNDPSKLVYDLLNYYIDGLIVQASFMSDLQTIAPYFLNETIFIKSFSVEQERILGVSDKDITRHNFVIFVSGVDVYGDVLTRARTDMNMLLYVNPSTKKILMVSIPRDTYLPLGCEMGEMDKLTHTSLYGIDCSIGSLEMLMGTSIDFYLRINFSGLVDLVDALEGVNVRSYYDFTTDSGYPFEKGINFVNGDAALAFARERNHLEYGDVSRGIHHQELMLAIMDKAMDVSNITKLPRIAMMLQNIVDTNIQSKAIASFISQKMDNDKSWKVETLLLEGTGDMQSVHSLGMQYKYYVYWPNYDSLNNIKEQARILFSED